jgi:hypothetical protein
LIRKKILLEKLKIHLKIRGLIVVEDFQILMDAIFLITSI